MLNIVSSVIGAAGSVISSFFGWKGDQAKTVQASLEVLKSVNDMDGQALQAHAQAISALLTQGIWLERIWRPLLMITFMGIIISYWFTGYTPPHFNTPMSPMMVEIFSLLKIGLMGYIPGRTVEKIITQMQIGAVLRELIKKKIA